MAIAGIVNGTRLKVYIGGVAVLGSTSCQVNYNQSTRDATTKESGGSSESLEGMTDWDISVEGLFSFDSAYGQVDLLDLAIARTPFQVRFSSNESGEEYYQGNAYVESASITGGLEESAGYSCKFKGTGVLNKLTKT